MSDIAPPRNLTPGLCKTIEAEMLKACNDVAAMHGLVAEGLGMQAMDLPHSDACYVSENGGAKVGHGSGGMSLLRAA